MLRPLRRLVLVTPGLLITLASLGCGETAIEPATQSATATLVEAPTTQTPDAPEPFVPGLEIEPDDFETEEGFHRLSLNDFVPFQSDETTWQEIEGVLVCSGEPKGYAHSSKTFGNFTWRAEYRFVPVGDAEKHPKSNTGFMIHIQPKHKVWPESLEVQGRWDEMCSIKSNGGVPNLTIVDDEAARQSARKPVGEWNAVEIVSQNGAFTATLNGQLICKSEPGELTEGFIGLQSELFEVHFRRMRIREDD